jgi:UDP-galactopyranose mutase
MVWSSKVYSATQVINKKNIDCGYTRGCEYEFLGNNHERVMRVIRKNRNV